MAATMTWTTSSPQSTPGVSVAMPTALAMKVPIRAATTPMTIVSQIGMFWRPGTTRRPSAPTIRPTISAVMMPVTVISFLLRSSNSTCTVAALIPDKPSGGTPPRPADYEDGLLVPRGHRDAVVAAGPVAAPDEVHQVRGEGRLAGLVQGREGLQRRAVPAAQEPD